MARYYRQLLSATSAVLINSAIFEANFAGDSCIGGRPVACLVKIVNFRNNYAAVDMKDDNLLDNKTLSSAPRLII